MKLSEELKREIEERFGQSMKGDVEIMNWTLEMAAQECEGFADGLPLEANPHIARVCCERIRALKENNGT